MPTRRSPREPALNTLGSRIREERHRLGWSQEALADAAGLHWTFVGQVERGRRNLSFNNLLKLSDALHVDPAELVHDLHGPV